MSKKLTEYDYKWLAREIKEWKNKGIINQEQSEKILSNYYTEKKEVTRVNTIKVLAMIGSIMLGLGIILFVATNWRYIPNLIKTIMLLGGTSITLISGYYLKFEKRKVPLGEGILVAASLFWGGTLALITQIYHVPISDNHIIFLTWALTIIPIAYLLESRPVYYLSSLLFFIWNFMYIGTYRSPSYIYPLIVFLVLYPLAKNNKLGLFGNTGALIFTGMSLLGNGGEWFNLTIALGFLIYGLKTNKILLSVSSVSFTLWNLSFIIGRTIPNYFYILPLIILTYLAYSRKSKTLLISNIVGFLIWINIFMWDTYALLSNNKTYDFFDNIEKYALYITILIVTNLFIGLTLYLLGKIHDTQEYKSFNTVFKIVGISISLILTHLFSFMGIVDEITKIMKETSEKIFTSNIYLMWPMFFGVTTLLLLMLTMMKKDERRLNKYELINIVMMLTLGIIMTFLSELVTIKIILANLIILFSGIGCIMTGFENQKPIIFNAGIAILVILIISRYFDIFWALIDRSVFFIFGGFLMLFGSIFLERKRRKIVSEMKEYETD